MLPHFYIASYEAGTHITLDEDNSRHIVQVLRMKQNDPLQLTDGKGNLLTARIADAHKKKCIVTLEQSSFIPPRIDRVSIAISLLKNAHRFEWFLEKAMEIGVTSIIPLLCERTEKQHFRQDRMHSILVSAMLQSQQAWLPELHPPTPSAQLIEAAPAGKKFIAHCLDDKKSSLAEQASGSSSLILIGPEGDFTQKEIDLALGQGFIPVTLGKTRLRTETAGIVAATLLLNLPC